MNRHTFGTPVAFVSSVRVPTKLENVALQAHVLPVSPSAQGTSFAQTMSLAAKSAAESRAAGEHHRRETAARKADASKSAQQELVSNGPPPKTPAAAKPLPSQWNLNPSHAHDQANQHNGPFTVSEAAQDQDETKQQYASASPINATPGAAQTTQQVSSVNAASIGNETAAQRVAAAQTVAVQELNSTDRQVFAVTQTETADGLDQGNPKVVPAAQTEGVSAADQPSQPIAATAQSVESKTDERVSAAESGSAMKKLDQGIQSAARQHPSAPATSVTSAKGDTRSHAEGTDASGETPKGIEQTPSAPMPPLEAANATDIPGFSSLLPGTASDSTVLPPQGEAAVTANSASSAGSDSTAGDLKQKVVSASPAAIAQGVTPKVSALFSAAAGNGGGNKAGTQSGGNGEAMQQVVQASAPQSVGTNVMDAKSHSNAAGNASASLLSSAAAADAPEVVPAKTVLNTSQLIQSMHSSEMRLGMNSAEFGAISISTSISHQVLSASISLGHAELSRALAQQMPAMQEKLSSTYGVQARVEMRDANGTNQQQGGSRQNRQEPGSTGSSSISSTSSAFPSATAALSSNPSASLATGSTRLDVLY